MQLNCANLVNELIPSQINQLSTLSNIIITSAVNKRNMPNPIIFTKTPANKNEAHAILKGGSYSIVNNFPAPKITYNSSMVNVDAN